MRRSLTIPAVTLVAALSLTACGGGGGSDKPNTSASPSSTFNPSRGASMQLAGTVATGAPLPGTPITVYDASGKVCSQTTSNASGAYSIAATCAFPVMVVADTPELEGKALYTLIPTITSEGQSVRANLTPITSTITQLVLKALPRLGAALSKDLVNQTNLDAANAKVHEVLDPLLQQMGAGPQDFLGGQIVVGQGQDLLMDSMTITYENIPSTYQNLFRFQLASEHRPLVLVHNTRQAITTATVDPGLGVAPELVSAANLTATQTAYAEIRTFLENKTSSQVSALVDPSCYLHNGATSTKVLFDVTDGGPIPLTSVFNTQLINYNTYTNFANQTEEKVNDGAGQLAYVSFDYLDGHGLKQRAYTWLIKGSQSVNGCSSSGTGWRVLGNQRPIYLRTNTYALHRIMYNSAFAGRTDQYGTGTEHFIADPAGQYVYAFAIVSGPGLPDNGVIFVRLDGSYLKYNGTISSIRSNAATPSRIFDAVEDTRSYLMNDTQVSKITDAYHAPQNRYTVRLFRDFADLYPSLTLLDTIPKRPYLNTELPVGYFHTVGVNLDALVTALQTGSSVTVNWSIPLDLRSRSMIPDQVAFMRKNCRLVSEWPNCGSRSKQVNEYWLGGVKISNPDLASLDMTPPSLPPSGSKTFESHIRVQHLDTLARPIEVDVGMTYQR